MLLEAWRTCLRDEFDLTHLAMLLDEIVSGTLRVSEAATPSPSPFCGTLVWKQTNTLMYEDDTPPGAAGTSLRGDLVRELALSPDLRPRIAAETAALVQAKLHRTAEGYAPRDARELLDWTRERILVPSAEWQELLAACARDYGLDPAGLEEELGDRIARVALGEPGAVCASDVLPRVERAREKLDGPEMEQIVAEWLRFYGPVDPSRIAAVFGIPAGSVSSLVADLAEEETLVIDRIIDGTSEPAICDRENLERLLRSARARARPAVHARPVAELPLFLARRHGLLEKGRDEEALKRCWDMLFGYPLLAHAWEEEVLPARLEGYRSQWLDSLVASAGLRWTGCGRQRVVFSFEADRELFATEPSTEAREGASALFPEGPGRLSFWDLADRARSLGRSKDSRDLAEKLWDLAWKGAVANESFEAVRRGIANGFRAPEPARPAGRGRPGFDRWQAARPSLGLWMQTPAGEPGVPAPDALESEELNRDRIRQVLHRYGVVFREILENELPPLRWPRLFRSLRVLEFSGEVVAGRFFEGIHGLQFATPAALKELVSEAGREAVWWVNAADPASLCGVDIEGLKQLLPPRLPTTHVVFHGEMPVLVSRRRGRELEIRVPPDAPRLAEYFSFFRVLTGREQRPMNALHVETVNGEAPGTSPYRGVLLTFGFVEEFRRFTLRAGI
jgi:ATP-dependent Lhr-like helicase